jgi:hypothetical protein
VTGLRQSRTNGVDLKLPAADGGTIVDAASARDRQAEARGLSTKSNDARREPSAALSTCINSESLKMHIRPLVKECFRRG